MNGLHGIGICDTNNVLNWCNNYMRDFELQICESRTFFLQTIYNNAKWSIVVPIIEELEVDSDKVNGGGKIVYKHALLTIF
jgi:hypothetical protein